VGGFSTGTQKKLDFRGGRGKENRFPNRGNIGPAGVPRQAERGPRGAGSLVGLMDESNGDTPGAEPMWDSKKEKHWQKELNSNSIPERTSHKGTKKKRTSVG